MSLSLYPIRVVLHMNVLFMHLSTKSGLVSMATKPYNSSPKKVEFNDAFIARVLTLFNASSRTYANENSGRNH